MQTIADIDKDNTSLAEGTLTNVGAIPQPIFPIQFGHIQETDTNHNSSLSFPLSNVGWAWDYAPTGTVGRSFGFELNEKGSFKKLSLLNGQAGDVRVTPSDVFILYSDDNTAWYGFADATIEIDNTSDPAVITVTANTYPVKAKYWKFTCRAPNTSYTFRDEGFVVEWLSDAVVFNTETLSGLGLECFYDDFSGGALDVTKWNTQNTSEGSIDIVNEKLVIENTTSGSSLPLGIYSNETFPVGSYVEARVRHDNGKHFAVIGLSEAPFYQAPHGKVGQYGTSIYSRRSDADIITSIRDDSNTTLYGVFAESEPLFHTFGIYRIAENEIRYFRDGILLKTDTSHTLANAYQLYFTGDGYTVPDRVYIDWVRGLKVTQGNRVSPPLDLSTLGSVHSSNITYNGYNQIRENVALGKTTTASHALNGEYLAFVTNGNTSTNEYIGIPSVNKTVSITVDLGDVYRINELQIWHYYGDSRQYQSLVTSVSEDGVTWQNVFRSSISGQYTETSAGRTHKFLTRKVRYIRESTTGNTTNDYGHWVEVKAFTSDVTTAVETSVDGGVTWQAATSGEPIPNLPYGTDASSLLINCRQELSANDLAVFPQLDSVEVEVNGEIRNFFMFAF